MSATSIGGEEIIERQGPWKEGGRRASVAQESDSSEGVQTKEVTMRRGIKRGRRKRRWKAEI